MINLDIDLVKKIKNWDKNSMTDLYSKYFDKIYNYFFYRVNNTNDCEDLCSETFFAVFESIKNFDESKYKNLSPWIYSIAYRKLCDFFEKTKKKYSKEMSLIEENIESYYDEDILKNIDNKQKIKELFCFLEQTHKYAKDIVIMKVWENMTHEEISQALWISLANSKKIYSRSIEKSIEKFGNLTVVSFILLSTKIWLI